MAAIEKLLLKVEQSIHRNGWDQEPFLGFLIQPRPDLLGLVRLPLTILNPPADFLQFLAGRLSAEPDVTRAIVSEYPGLQGIAFVCEGWQAPKGMTREQLNEAAARGLGLADLPGAEENRMVSAVMLTGQVIMVLRVRGQKPVCHSFDVQYNGRVPAALTAILAQVAPHVPDGDAYVQILQDLLEQIQAKNTEHEMTTES